MSLTVRITRDLLDLEPLDLHSDATDARFWLADTEHPKPSLTPWRHRDGHSLGHEIRALMTSQPTTFGGTPLAVTGLLLTLDVYAQAPWADLLFAARSELSTAFGQRRYTIIATTESEATTWDAGIGHATWAPITGPSVRTMKVARAHFSIPVSHERVLCV